MPGSLEPADRLYERLLQLHDETFEAGRFELSYHVLAAALHAAEEMDNVELLAGVAELSKRRQAEIDRSQPELKVSSASAAGRGNVALFTALAATAGAARGRIVADQAVHRLRDSAGEAL